MLNIPNFDKGFVLATDVSAVAVSAILHQDVDGAMAPIANYNRVLSAVECKYSTYECQAGLLGCEKFRSPLAQRGTPTL